MHYRRARVPGATYFFTVNLANRSSRLLTDKIDDMRPYARFTVHIRFRSLLGVCYLNILESQKRFLVLRLYTLRELSVAW